MCEIFLEYGFQWNLENGDFYDAMNVVCLILTRLQYGCTIVFIYLCYYVLVQPIEVLKSIVPADVVFKPTAFHSGWTIINQ